MIITIRITEAAIEWLEAEAHLERDRAEEVGQMFINLCERSGYTDRELRLEEIIKGGFDVLLRYGDRGGWTIDGLSQAIESLISKLIRVDSQGYRIRRYARDLIAHRRGAGIHGDMEELRMIHDLEKALEEEEVSQAKPEDTLFKTADSLMRYYAEEGSESFRSRFGSLEILKTCREIIREGEGNPHPWRGRGDPGYE